MSERKKSPLITIKAIDSYPLLNNYFDQALIQHSDFTTCTSASFSTEYKALILICHNEVSGSPWLSHKLLVVRSYNNNFSRHKEIFFCSRLKEIAFKHACMSTVFLHFLTPTSTCLLNKMTTKHYCIWQTTPS